MDCAPREVPCRQRTANRQRALHPQMQSGVGAVPDVLTSTVRKCTESNQIDTTYAFVSFDSSQEHRVAGKDIDVCATP